jgi:glutaredoxin 2
MSPDSMESRVGRLEREMAAATQHLSDIDADVRALTPLVVGQAELRAAMGHMQIEITAIRTELAKTEVARQQERQSERQDKNKMRLALYAGCFTVLAAVISAAAAIIASAP